MRNQGTIIVALLILVLTGAMYYMVWRIPAPAAEGLKVSQTGTPDYHDLPLRGITETLDHGTTPQQVVSETPEHRVMPMRGITETPNSALCPDVIAAVRAVVPLNGVQFASPGGVARSVAVYGVTTGETESRTENGIEFDLARLQYLDNDKALRSLLFATGYVDKSGTYFPMNVTDPRGWQAWATRQEAEAIFQQSGKGIRLTLTGFLRGDKEIAWESCEQWAHANPLGICNLGLGLELAAHGGGSQFIQSSIAPENWFAFGWAVELNGPDATTPTNTGECVP